MTRSGSGCLASGTERGPRFQRRSSEPVAAVRLPRISRFLLLGKGLSMLRHVTIALVILAAAGTQSVVSANPITYDFTGTLGQPYDGTTSFSGSFTIVDAPVAGGVTEAGSESSMTLHFGNNVVTYSNNPQDPSTMFAFSVLPATGPSGEQNPPWYEIEVGGQSSRPGIGDFFITSYVPSSISTVTNLRNLTFPSNSTSYLSEPSPAVTNQGLLLSINAVPAPEPKTFVVFGMFGAALIAKRIRQRRGGLETGSGANSTPESSSSG